jgi:ATP-binding cassette subfamily B protein/subfamily B ATP-binding cassette protein MsbA
MKNFRRALKESLRYWPSLVLATFCSMAVAMLWSGNILAFYPILNTTLRGESVQQWIDREIDTLDEKIAEQEAELATYTAETADPDPLRLQKIQDTIGMDQGKRAGYEKMQPTIERWVPQSPFNTVALIVGVLMISTFIKHVFLVINEVLVGRAAIDISRMIRLKVFSKALFLDRATFSTYGTSGFSAHITHTSEGLAQGLMNTLGGAVREPMKIVACLAGAAYINPRLLLLSLLVAPVVGFMLVWLTKRLKTISKRVLLKAGSFHEVMLESLGNIQTVQAYNMEQRESDRFEAATLDMRNFGLRFIFYTALTKPVIELLGVGMLCTTLVAGAYLVLNQETSIFGIPLSSQPMEVAQLLTFFGCLVGASDPLRKLSAVYSSIYAGSVAADALYPLLDTDSQVAEPAKPVPFPKNHRNIQLENLTFGYLPGHDILKDVSLDIPFGSTIAIVGANGTGKSTLINLLCRFYDPSEGRVKIDGYDIRDFAIDDLRQQLALVTQQTELFNDTIEYNIRYGSHDVTEEQILAASASAHAHEFISTVLPEGYETRVGQNGHRLSGGQRQRISLARALLRDPEILILDEATSQIDMHSEQLIRESLKEHLGKRTVIIITHREALLDLADVIYTVEHQRMKVTYRRDVKTAA